MIWSPIIVTSQGRQQEDGRIDQSTIYGQPPIVGGSLSNEDLDPEKNIFHALSNFALDKGRKKIFTRIASKKYVVPEGLDLSANSAKLVIDRTKIIT